MRKKHKIMLPKISIVTPSYNQGLYLEKTILSVLDQKYPALEYIIIDGASKDNSVEIIKKYESRLSCWISAPDKGQADAINKGFDRASGSIIGWVNSDDIYLPNSFFTVADYFMKHPHIGCVSGDLIIIGPRGNTLFTRKVTPFQFNTALYGGCMVPQPSTFFRRSVLSKTGQLNLSYYYWFDYEFFIRMYVSGVKFGIISESLAAFRLQSMSKTLSKRDNIAEENRLKIVRKYSKLPIKNMVIKRIIFTLLKWLYRTKNYFIRAFTRRDFAPFRYMFGQKKIGL